MGAGGRNVLHCVLLLGHPDPEGKHGPDEWESCFPSGEGFLRVGTSYLLLCAGKTVGEMALAVLGWEGCTLPAPEDTVALCAQALEGTSALLWLQEALENIPEHPAAVLGCGAWLGEQGASPHKALEAEFRSELLMAVVSWWRLVARLGCWGLSSGSQEGEGREKRRG